MTTHKRARAQSAIALPSSEQAPGQTMVEFALILPFLLILIIGIMGFTLLFFSYVTMQNAVREGTTHIVHNTRNTTIAQVKQLVISYTVALDRSAMRVDVSPSESAWVSGARVSVSAYYTVPLPTISIPTLSGRIDVISPFQVHADSVMTIE
jgi:Flp pilus assembly protein TadG